MPIESRKPVLSPNAFKPPPETPPTQSHFVSGQSQFNAMPAQMKRWIDQVNKEVLARTQPFPRAAELREGNSFRRRQEEMIRKEASS